MMKALIIVDLQNDFMPGGPLGVPGANELAPLINSLISKFNFIIASQDWHPQDHVSFASNHQGKKIGDLIDVNGLDQVLWPDHCVQNTEGSELISSLNKENITSLFYKGTDKNIDSYSVFFDNAHHKSTGLADFLKEHHVTDLYFVGVATEYCVLYSALDAIDLGFSVHVISDGCRGINLTAGEEEKAYRAIASKGGKIITSVDLL